ncbi:hypothetical protein B0T17DRAFT_544924 [Bombardia bombarda]|uniref:SnoaL-like domain-containing protein n=1 Tax=Bombardia bombarda TaxID=252184 RepID=A0AA39TGX3_9PEZI|nr:hypothetical protein B0T17DRAFT_544924 [Bombardia bombarda]
MPSQRIETAKKFIGQFATFDSKTLEEVISDDFYQEFAPASIDPPMGPFDKTAMLEQGNKLSALFSGFVMTAKEYIDSAEENKVTVWTTGKAIFRDDVKDDGLTPEEWDFRGEYIFLLTFNEAGKIKKVVEFLDSQSTAAKLHPLIKRAVGNKQKAAAK